MCGIIGYVGQGQAGSIQNVIMDALSRLEYRGYDSAGIVVLNKQGRLDAVKAAGPLSVLRQRLNGRQLEGVLGIGHTRWATHGEPVDRNAHPHLSADESVAIIHNGIIENFEALRDELKRAGVKFRSDTDSEILAHLIERNYRGSLAEAVRIALATVDGNYSLCVISNREPDTLVVARKHSPLIIGLGQGQNFVASDVPAIMPHTRSVIYLGEKQMAVLTPDKVTVTDLEGNAVEATTHNVEWDLEQAQKEGYAHFMLKEIFEQPRSLAATLRGRVDRGNVYLDDVHMSDESIRSFNKVVFLACGTAHHAGMVGKYAFEEWAGISTEAVIASEFRYADPVIDDKTLAVAISQSGETMDTLAALKLAREKGAATLAVCNVVGSSLTREAAETFYMRCGPEIGVASTKVYTSMLTSLFLLAAGFGRIRRAVSAEAASQLVTELSELPRWTTAILEKAGQLQALGVKYKDTKNFMYIGRRYNYPTAFEAALKLKEISYIHAEGYAGGEMKHGPLALVDDTLVTVAIVPQGRTHSKMVSNIQEVRARKGRMIALASEGDSQISKYCDDLVLIPPCSEIVSAVLSIVPLQLFAYAIAAANGRDVDKPRNLAKSVTVE